MEDIDKLWNYDDAAASEAIFRAKLAEADQHDLSWKIVLLTQLARAQGLQDKFGEAHATLTEAEKLLDSQDSLPRVRYLLERGRVFNSAKEPEKAAPLFQAAFDMGRAIGDDFYAIDAAHMLGICRPPADAMEWNRRALELANKTTQKRAQGWQGPILNNMGWTLFDSGDFNGALDYLRQAQAVREERGEKPQILIARWAVARTLRALGRVSEALAMQEALAAEHQAAATNDKFVDEELAECRRLLYGTASVDDK